MFGSIETSVRLHPRASEKKSVIWEGDCAFLPVTVETFCDWLLQKDISGGHPLCAFDPSIFWAYADYKHFESFFKDYPGCSLWCHILIFDRVSFHGHLYTFSFHDLTSFGCIFWDHPILLGLSPPTHMLPHTPYNTLQESRVLSIGVYLE